ncbi:MAG: LLM class flavin-dependent oxidoreductase [Acidobacteria bacterium]|nr:LLM class flavin-dependent oxidoreductase [Acidobacteriota bacterium]
MDRPLRFGLFLAPFHHPEQNPTRSLRRDLELLVRADELGYTEAWIGEHYSTGHEIIAGGDLFVAAAAERTHRLKLGTGVISLPFHHPFVVANRAVQLDHMTMGRFMLGVGPGSLPTDSRMMGLDHLQQREMMVESFEAIMALLTSDEPVTRKTSWFTLDDAELQLRPYSWPLFETAVAAVESPVGPQLAGRHGAALLSLAASSGPGFLAMPRMWSALEETAAQQGLAVPDRARWRVCGMMHVAETRAQALADVRHGLRQYVDYNTRVSGKVVGDPLADGTAPGAEASIEQLAEGILERRSACIGSPEDAVEFIQRLVDNSEGGFGTFLLMLNDWANPEATIRSLDLIAREVFPIFDGSSAKPFAAQEKAAAQRGEGAHLSRLAVQQATERYERDTSPAAHPKP